MKKRWSLLFMILLYIVVGVNHFVHPLFYVGIMPYYIPYKLELVYISGFCEFVFGLLLISYKTRKVASWLIILMLIAFLPVHIQMILDHYKEMNGTFWIAMVRLPLQYVLIRWAWIISVKYNYRVLEGKPWPGKKSTGSV